MSNFAQPSDEERFGVRADYFAELVTFEQNLLLKGSKLSGVDGSVDREYCADPLLFKKPSPGIS